MCKLRLGRLDYISSYLLTFLPLLSVSLSILPPYSGGYRRRSHPVALCQVSPHMLSLKEIFLGGPGRDPGQHEGSRLSAAASPAETA